MLWCTITSAWRSQSLPGGVLAQWLNIFTLIIILFLPSATFLLFLLFLSTMDSATTVREYEAQTLVGQAGFL